MSKKPGRRVEKIELTVNAMAYETELRIDHDHILYLMMDDPAMRISGTDLRPRVA